jgi:copper homeostasis protein
MREPRLLEIPVDAVAEAERAAAFADRLELCSDLAAEGFTAEPRFVAEVRRFFRGELVALIRPREAIAVDRGAPTLCFPAAASAVRRAIAEIRELAEAGCDAVAFAAIGESGDLDEAACAAMAEAARRCGARPCLHRGFDLALDRRAAWRIAAEIGIVRVLTSGASGRWVEERGAPQRVAQLRGDALDLAAIGERAPGIVACGGLRAAEAPLFLEVAREIHAACRERGRFCKEAAAALRRVLDGARASETGDRVGARP